MKNCLFGDAIYVDNAPWPTCPTSSMKTQYPNCLEQMCLRTYQTYDHHWNMPKRKRDKTYQFSPLTKYRILQIFRLWFLIVKLVGRKNFRHCIIHTYFPSDLSESSIQSIFCTHFTRWFEEMKNAFFPNALSLSLSLSFSSTQNAQHWYRKSTHTSMVCIYFALECSRTNM